MTSELQDEGFALQRGRLGSRVATSAMLLTGLNFLVRSLSFLTVIVLARILMPEAFGLVALATTIMGAIEVLTNFSVGNALIRIRNVEKAHFDTAFTIGALRGVLTAAGLALLARPLAILMEMP
ncbi:MAG: oligosaccharide flippase family protein, partial [Sphingomonadaceae bacterium]